MRRPLVRLGLLLAVLLAAGASEARSWAWLGVRIRDLSEPEVEELSKRHGIREGFGVVIVEVMEDTPAARAGMRSGDVVVAFERRPVVDSRLLQRLIAAAPMEREVRLTVLRPDGREPVDVRLAPMPREVVGERVAAEFGFVLRRAEEASAGTGAAGPVAEPAPAVGFVMKDTPAARAGLETGDVLLQIGEEAVASGEAARAALAAVDPARPLSLVVRRQDRRLVLTLSVSGR